MIKLKFDVKIFHKNGKNAKLGQDTGYKHGLQPKFEERPFKGQNKTLPMFLEDTVSPFHSAIESGICRNFMEFDQNCNF